MSKKYIVKITADDDTIYAYEVEAEYAHVAEASARKEHARFVSPTCKGVVCEEVVPGKAELSPYLVTVRLKINPTQTNEYLFTVLEDSTRAAEMAAYSLIDFEVRSNVPRKDISFKVEKLKDSSHKTNKCKLPNNDNLMHAWQELKKNRLDIKETQDDEISYFEIEVLIVKARAAIKIVEIILDKWEKSFPDERYFPTAPKWTAVGLRMILNKASRALYHGDYEALREYTNQLWRYIEGPTPKALRWSPSAIRSSIVDYLPNARVSFLNNNTLVCIQPGDGRDSITCSMGYFQKFDVAENIGSEIFWMFSNIEKGY